MILLQQLYAQANNNNSELTIGESSSEKCSRSISIVFQLILFNFHLIFYFKKHQPNTIRLRHEKFLSAQIAESLQNNPEKLLVFITFKGINFRLDHETRETQLKHQLELIEN